MDNQSGQPEHPDQSKEQPTKQAQTQGKAGEKSLSDHVFNVYMVFVAIISLVVSLGILQGMGSGILQSGISCAFSRVVVKLKSAS